MVSARGSAAAGGTRLELERRDDVAVLWLDPAGARVNTFTRALVASFGALLTEVEQAADVHGLIVASRAPQHFAAGADVTELATLTTPDQVRAVLKEGNALLDRIEAFPKPIVIAVDGACLGAGLELALACHTRLATDQAATAFALPEVRLGLLPGLGGTQRLPRRIGVSAALPLILKGRKVGARQALELGLVDEVVTAEALMDAAFRAVREGPREHPAPGPRSRPWLKQALERPPLRALLWRQAQRQAQRVRGNHYPALQRIVSVVREGVERGPTAGAAAESAAFAELLFTPEARALLHLFFARAAARKNPWQADARQVRTVAVVGAGLMGAGIAQVSAKAGLEVLLKDRDFDLAARGLEAARHGLGRAVGRGISEEDRDRMVQRLVPVADYAALAGADLTIEAVHEELELKRSVLAAVQAVSGPDHLYASNTSAIPIAKLAAGALRPDAVVGMHYFSPVPKMPLLEVVIAEGTADWARATAVETGLRQGKTVIVVRDSPGFYTTRVLARYTFEALRMLEEGVDVTVIDAAMVAFGFPLGPFALLDDVGLDVAAHIQRVLAPTFEARGFKSGTVLGRLVAAGYGGRKIDRGFYRYRDGKRLRELDRRLYATTRLAARSMVSRSEVQERLALSFVDEAVRCLDEGVLRGPAAGDVGAVFGLGFPPFLGGPFRWADQRGCAEIVASLEAFRQRFGERFAPAAGLLRRAADNERFASAAGPLRRAAEDERFEV